MRKAMIRSVALAAVVLPAGAQAGALMCSLSTIRACDEMMGCTRIQHEEANVPRFWKVDLDKKTISGTRPDGSEASTEIKTTVATLMRVTIQGIENGRAWAATIGDDGSLSLVVSGEGFGFIGFGACTNL